MPKLRLQQINIQKQTADISPSTAPLQKAIQFACTVRVQGECLLSKMMMSRYGLLHVTFMHCLGIIGFATSCPHQN